MTIRRGSVRLSDTPAPAVGAHIERRTTLGDRAAEVQTVRLVSAATAHPHNRISQAEAASRIADSIGDRRRVEAIARGSQIESRAVLLTPDAIAGLSSIEERNAIYESEAPRLAQAAVDALETCVEDVSCLVTSSCTGYLVPGLDVLLASRLHLSPRAVRLPITEAGCAGGVVALARAADRLRLRPSSALVVAAELCSLAFHADPEDGNLTSALLFGDGAAAAYLTSRPSGQEGLEIVDSASYLVPCSQEALGFRLTDAGFYPVLVRNLDERLTAPTANALAHLLASHGLSMGDVGFWLVHPGGPRILANLQKALGLDADALRWSWQVLRHSGNTSSAAIIEVIASFMADPEAPRGWGVAVAFGPGISIEMLLLRRC